MLISSSKVLSPLPCFCTAQRCRDTIPMFAGMKKVCLTFGWQALQASKQPRLERQEEGKHTSKALDNILYLLGNSEFWFNSNALHSKCSRASKCAPQTLLFLRHKCCTVTCGLAVPIWCGPASNAGDRNSHLFLSSFLHAPPHSSPWDTVCIPDSWVK